MVGSFDAFAYFRLVFTRVLCSVFTEAPGAVDQLCKVQSLSFTHSSIQHLSLATSTRSILLFRSQHFSEDGVG